MNNLHLISHQNSQGRGERECFFGSREQEREWLGLLPKFGNGNDGKREFLSKGILILMKFKLCMLPSCSHLFTDFRAVFVLALGPFFPVWVLFSM